MTQNSLQTDSDLTRQTNKHIFKTTLFFYHVIIAQHWIYLGLDRNWVLYV